MSFVATKAIIGHKTSIAYGAVPSVGYTLLAEIIGFTPPKTTVAMVDASRFDSDVTANGNPIEDQITGWLKPGEYSFKAHYDKNGTQATTIRGLLGAQHSWQMTYPDAKTRSFIGVLTEYGEEVPLKDKMTLDFKVTINGGADQTLA